MRQRSSIPIRLLGATLALGGCGGLIAGPEVAGTTPVPASQDSAYARARRGLSAEAFTMDVVDSAHGRLTGTRYPSPGGRLGTSQVCRVVLAMDIKPTGDRAGVSTRTRWVAPDEMADTAPEVCDQERNDVLDRLNQTLVPVAPQ